MKEREHNKKIKKITEKTAGVDLKYWRNTENKYKYMYSFN